MNDADTTWLVVVFSKRPSLALTRNDLDDGFRVGSISFEPLEGDGLASCYDRLLDEKGALVGVRIWPVEPAVSLLLTSLALPYVVGPPDEPFVDVFLDGQRRAVTSGDEQAFGGQFFRSFSGEVAMSLDLTYLAQAGSDIPALRRLTVDWFEPKI